jgi:DNA-binding CsgD family transcriptional regulator
VTYFQTATDFIDVAKRASSDEELSHAFLEAIRSIGFSEFACLALVDQDNMPENFVRILSYSDQWVEHYTNERYNQIDPTLSRAMGSSMPFRWSESIDMSKLTSQQKQLFADAADEGIKYGFTVPIHNRLVHSASVSIVGDCEEVSMDAYNSVHLMSVYLHEAALRILNSNKEKQKKAKLTSRERECLKWVAMGKSDWEIGEILGISKNTVHFHVENAKEKFETFSRVQAVTEALLSNNISL